MILFKQQFVDQKEEHRQHDRQIEITEQERKETVAADADDPHASERQHQKDDQCDRREPV